jgi:hypothetical protein
MKVWLKSVVTAAIAVLAAVFLVSILGTAPALAITVVNPDFESPSIGQIAAGYIQCPQTTSAIGWTFSCPANAAGTGFVGVSGVQKNGSLLNAAPAPPGHQTAFIENAGVISQTIEFQYGGTYTLGFYLSAAADSVPTNTIATLQVTIEDEAKPHPQQVASQGFTPTSTSSFQYVTMPFTIPAPGKYVFSFTNSQTVACQTCFNFFYGVSINAPAAKITKWPLDIHPNSTVSVEGLNFGPKGRIELGFSPPALTNFAGGGKNELVLDPNNAPNSWVGSIGDGAKNSAESEKILDASQIGAVSNNQTVWIYVNTGDGRVSDGVKANFHNDAIITKGPATISPRKAFNLSGWDFGEAGTVEIHFKNNPFGSSSLDSHFNLKGLKVVWEPWVMNVTLPDVSGVAEQNVEISFTTKDGQKSNVWPAKFVPEMVLVSGYQPAHSLNPVVTSCGNEGVFNWCSGTNSYNSCWLSSPAPSSYPAGVVWQDVNMLGFHSGCAGIGSYNGTDTYRASYLNGWTIENFFFSVFEEDNGTANVTNPPPPTNSMNIAVDWHVGAEGGAVNYYSIIYIKGPIGIPWE